MTYKAIVKMMVKTEAVAWIEKQEMERFDFTGDLGYCNQTAELKK